jgi:hypothetical protein
MILLDVIAASASQIKTSQISCLATPGITSNDYSSAFRNIRSKSTDLLRLQMAGENYILHSLMVSVPFHYHHQYDAPSTSTAATSISCNKWFLKLAGPLTLTDL